MEPIFTVYQRVNGSSIESCGLQECGDQRYAIRVKNGALVSRKKLRLADIGLEIGGLLRSGFRMHATHNFFDEDLCVFTTTHPDFRDNTAYVLFTEPTDVAQAIIEMESMAMKAVGVSEVPVTMIQQWINSEEQHTRYLVAPTSHPLFALLLAQQAIRLGFPLHCAKPGSPQTSPDASPLEWTDWLSGFFARQTVLMAQNALGWSNAKLLSTMDAGVVCDPMLASNFL